MPQYPPAPGEMPAPKTPATFLREHAAYVTTAVSAGTLLTLARIWNEQGAEHSTGAAALMLAFGGASGLFAVRLDDPTAQAVFASGAMTFGALSVGVYSDPIAPALIIWAVALITSCVMIGRSHRTDHRVQRAHLNDLQARNLERNADLSIAKIEASALVDAAREQSTLMAALEEARAHRSALDENGAVDPMAMLRATGQLPKLSVVHDDADRRTA
ncbi:hypothetical protein OG413_45865 [Streptomyces sp. NBC_01433]|uniref:hypothetical protein n=1 Tax=Streptomyces sp. NBC_01433 TaxID=2903864 RepID=UPI00225B9C40|nr:hypothetical protein [Streptomyces sp. NBC_01433]MCX4682460.1 hypothetical protein [Streptomyces sp. NBC_01433]MCX4682513.1 hypothetical protein [Streptomyces sp. NBC_01433]